MVRVFAANYARRGRPAKEITDICETSRAIDSFLAKVFIRDDTL